MFNTMQALPVIDPVQLRRSIVLSIVEGLLTGLPYVLFLYLVQTLIAPQPAVADVAVITLAIGLILLLRIWVTRLTLIHTGMMTSVTCAQLRGKLAAHFLKVPMGFFQQYDLGHLSNSMNRDVEFAEGIFSHLFSTLFATVSLLLLVSCILFFYDWRLTLAMLAGVPLAVWLQWWVQRRINPVSAQWLDAVSDTNGAIMDWVLGFKAHRLAGNSEQQLEGLRRRIRDTQNLSLQHEAKVGLAPVIFMLLSESGFALFLLLGVHLYFTGQVELAVFLTFLIVSVKVYRALSQIAMTMAQSRFMEHAALRLLKLLNSKTFKSGDRGANGPGAITVKDLCFRYAGTSAEESSGDHTKDNLHNISFNARPGMLTAIVGPSGAGKTTLINMLARFWPQDSGEILLDGQAIDSFPDRSLYQHLSLVSQHTFLLDDTIMANMLMARPGITEADVVDACKRAFCHDFIQQLPQGYDTHIGEMGGALSGGERQRIALARALLVDAKIILLDEISSALDVENEHNILQMLHQLKEDRTLIMIAHQEMLVKDADQVLFLKQGELAGQGSHRTLLEQNAKYREHWLYAH